MEYNAASALQGKSEFNCSVKVSSELLCFVLKYSCFSTVYFRTDFKNRLLCSQTMLMMEAVCVSSTNSLFLQQRLLSVEKCYLAYWELECCH